MMTERETEIELGTSAAEGITSFAAHDRLIEYGRNMPEKTYSVSRANLIFSQFKNLYTIAFFAMGLISLILDFKGSMPVWILFFLTAVLNAALGVRRDLVSRRAAMHFDKLRADAVRIVRDGKETETDPTLLVKGDVIILKKGDIVPADARILVCKDLKADESFFRRNSVPVIKTSEKMESEGDITEQRNMLFCGSVIIDGTVRAAVVETGGNTELAKMTESRSKKLNLQTSYSKNTPAEKLLVLSAVIASAILMVIISLKTKDPKNALLLSCSAAVCLLPALLRPVRVAAVKKCAVSLKRKQMEFGKNDFVYDIGAVDCLLIDKGKMLTDSSIKLEEEAAVDKNALVMAALCTECSFDEYGASAGDIDSAAVNAAIAAGINVKELFESQERVIVKPFDDAQKLMAVVCKRDGGYRLIVKGAIESVTARCSMLDTPDGAMALNGPALNDIERKSTSMAERGLKVRTVAYKDLEEIPESIENEINSLTLAGIFGYREIMAPKAAESVEILKSNFVKTYVVTGDHTITAAALAKDAKLIKSEQECVNCRDFDEKSDEELVEAAKEHKVFANAAMADRVRLVSALSADGKVTAVAGDQMSSPSVAMCAGVAFGKNDEGDYDVSMRRLSLENVAWAIAKCRSMRSNMTSASSIRASLGIAEVLILIFAALTESVFPLTVLKMAVLNIFIVLIPCFAAALFGRTRMAERGRRASLGCAVRGFTAAVFSLAVIGAAGYDAAVLFFAVHAVLEALRVSFTVRKKFDVFDMLYALMMIVFLILTFIVGGNLLEVSAGSGAMVFMFAVLNMVINVAVEFIRKRRAAL